MFKNSCESQFKKLLGELYFNTKNLRSSPDYELSIQKYQGIAPSVTISEVFRILKASEAFKEGVNTSCEKSEKIVENKKILGSKEIEDWKGSRDSGKSTSIKLHFSILQSLDPEKLWLIN